MKKMQKFLPEGLWPSNMSEIIHVRTLLQSYSRQLDVVSPLRFAVILPVWSCFKSSCHLSLNLLLWGPPRLHCRSPFIHRELHMLPLGQSLYGNRTDHGCYAVDTPVCALCLRCAPLMFLTECFVRWIGIFCCSAEVIFFTLCLSGDHIYFTPVLLS